MRPDDVVMLPVPRSALTLVAPPPEFVTEKNCEQVLGLPAAIYKRAAKSGAFPSTRIGRLHCAQIEVVRAFLLNHAETRSKRVAKAKSANDDEAWALGSGFRRPA